jgi:hypothetical protein
LFWLTVLTVITFEPILTALIKPAVVTVAVLGLDEDQVTDLLVALVGKTVATN